MDIRPPLTGPSQVGERGRWGPGRGWPRLRNVAPGTHSFQFFQGNKVQFGDISQLTIFILKTLTKLQTNKSV